jgi:hypothetical protein
VVTSICLEAAFHENGRQDIPHLLMVLAPEACLANAPSDPPKAEAVADVVFGREGDVE